MKQIIFMNSNNGSETKILLRIKSFKEIIKIQVNTYCHDITEILLKVALKNIKPTKKPTVILSFCIRNCCCCCCIAWWPIKCLCCNICCWLVRVLPATVNCCCTIVSINSIRIKTYYPHETEGFNNGNINLWIHLYVD